MLKVKHIFQGTGTLTVAITDVNDNPPICTKSSVFEQIPENTGKSISIVSENLFLVVCKQH